MLDDDGGHELWRESAPLAGMAWVDWTVGGAIVMLDGEHDVGTVDRVERAFVRAECTKPGLLVIDLSGCSLIDSSVVRELLAARDRAEAAARRVVLVVPSSAAVAVHSVLRVSGVVDRVEMSTTLEEALLGLGVAP